MWLLFLSLSWWNKSTKYFTISWNKFRHNADDVKWLLRQLPKSLEQILSKSLLINNYVQKINRNLRSFSMSQHCWYVLSKLTTENSITWQCSFLFFQVERRNALSVVTRNYVIFNRISASIKSDHLCEKNLKSWRRKIYLCSEKRHPQNGAFNRAQSFK